LCIVAILSALALAQTPAAPKTSPAKPGSGSTTAKSGQTKSPATTVDPDEGSVENSVYTSDFFHFTYKLPEAFEVDEAFLADLQDQSNTTFVLLAAQGPLSGEDRRDMVVIMADREDVTAESYVEKISRDYAQKQAFEILKPPYPVTISGKPFYRADFRKEGTYQSAVFTVLKGYAVGFNIAAPNEEAMNALIESLNSLKFPGATPAPKTPAKPTAPANAKPPAGDSKKGPSPNAPQR
jgi:hypothetical protein